MSDSLRLYGPYVACRAPLSIEFSRQEYWSGLSCLPPGDLPDPGIELLSLMSPALAGRFFTTSTSWEACYHVNVYLNTLTEGYVPKIFVS